MNNFLNVIKGIKNPREAVFGMIKGNTNPITKNLLEMAEKGDKEGIEQFARNLYKQQGKDFDKEFNDFINSLK